MQCKIRENFNFDDEDVEDVVAQDQKSIMLTDSNGNISLVKFEDTIMKLQGMVNKLADAKKQQEEEINNLKIKVGKIEDEVFGRYMTPEIKAMYKVNSMIGLNRLMSTTGAMKASFQQRMAGNLLVPYYTEP